MHFLATMTLAYIAFNPSLRAVFGRTFRLFPLPFPIPGPIAIAGGGFVVTALAGVFDGIWHTAFGLDETLWSFVEGKPVVNHWTTSKDVPAKTELSDRMSKDLNLSWSRLAKD